MYMYIVHVMRNKMKGCVFLFSCRLQLTKEVDELTTKLMTTEK